MSQTRGSTATPERGRSDSSEQGRGGPLGWLRGRLARVSLFYRQVIAELRKVIWPTRKELVTYTTVVLAFVLLVMAYVSVLDVGFGRLVFAVFG